MTSFWHFVFVFFLFFLSFSLFSFLFCMSTLSLYRRYRFCIVCLCLWLLVFSFKVTKKPHNIFLHLVHQQYFTFSLSFRCVFLHRYNPSPWAESCYLPSSFSPRCESFTLPHFLNWETRHLIAVRAGQRVIGFQRWLKLETLIPRISESGELQIPYHLH